MVPEARVLIDLLLDVCRGREHSQRCALYMEREEKNYAFLFLYATQNPLDAFFLPMTMVPSYVPDVANMGVTERIKALSATFEFEFEYKSGQYCTHSFLGFDEQDDVWVFVDLDATARGTMATDMDPIHFKDFVKGLIV